MAIDKALYQAPQGISDAIEPDLEIEIENPDAVRIGNGDVEIEMYPVKETAEDFDANLADYMDDGVLDSLGSDLIDDFEKDQRDRKDWIQTYVEV